MTHRAPPDADSALDNVDFPEEWETTEGEETRIVAERLAEYDRTGLYYAPEDVKAWLDARRDDPDAPPPAPRCKFG